MFFKLSVSRFVVRTYVDSFRDLGHWCRRLESVVVVGGGCDVSLKGIVVSPLVVRGYVNGENTYVIRWYWHGLCCVLFSFHWVVVERM